MIHRRTVLAAFGAGLLLGLAPATAQETATAIFAGGCFWSIESDFDHAPGVLETVSGYTGGHVEDPTYEQVVSETTGHREAVMVTYDPAVTDYATLLDAFWHMIDPTDAGGQFCDRGYSYTTAVYAGSEEEFALAEAGRDWVAEVLGQPVATAVEMAGAFYPAEDYHQDFWRSQLILANGRTAEEHYRLYRQGCGKNARVEEIWGEDAFKGLDGHA